MKIKEESAREKDRVESNQIGSRGADFVKKDSKGQEVFFPGVSEEEKEEIKKEAERVPILDKRGGFAEDDWQQRFDQHAKAPFSKNEFDGKFFEGFLDNQAFRSIHAEFELADGTIPEVWSASQLTPVL